MNKYIRICLLIISFITILAACNINTSNEKIENSQKAKDELENISGEVNESGNLIDEKKWAAKDIDLNSIKETVIEKGNMNEPYVMTDKEVNELYGLQYFEGIESLLIIEETNENYQEVAIIKLASEEQCDKIFENFISRYEKLLVEKNNYQTVFGTKKTISMTQQAGIGIMVISTNKDEIINSINEYF